MANTQKICVYLDYATIPTLNYALHFAENFADKETIRLFGLSRFSIPDSLIQRYPDGIVQFYPNQNKDFSSLLAALIGCVQKNQRQQRQCEIELHFNLFHYHFILPPFINFYLKYRDDCTIKLKCYDDGSEGVAALQDISQQPFLAEHIQFEKQQLSELFQTKAFTPTLLSRYLLSILFETEYILFNSAMLEKPELQILKQQINSYRQMDFGIYQKMNSEQKQIVLDIFNVDHKSVSRLIALTAHQPSFLFLGSTVFDVDAQERKAFIRLHFDLLKEHCMAGGHFFNHKENYLFSIKGILMSLNLINRSGRPLIMLLFYLILFPLKF